MSKPLLTMEIRQEHDVVLVRQRARQVAGLLGFDAQDQTRIATAVSEVARNAYQYAGAGKVEFLIQTTVPAKLLIRVEDRGPGIKNLRAVLDGQYVSQTGMGVGLAGARRLMDGFEIDSRAGGGTSVLIGKVLPARAPAPTPPVLARVADELTRRAAHDPFEELRRQNQELLQALDELSTRQEQLRQLNRELEDTNRGVVALYAELDEKADYLRRASEMKSRFLSNMSHEFRTPLNSILSLACILLDRTDGDLTAEQEKQVQFIRKGAEDLAELVNDLLDLAKVEAGKVVIRPLEFEAAGLFGALRGMLRPLLASNSAVALVFEDPVGLPSLRTDESKVSQIIRNFISNALKFTERGEVHVSAVAGPADTVVFSVVDTGIGIAPEDQEVIFQEFTQLESPRQRRVRGTGLGLPLSRKLAELLGGSVSVRSAPGVGSTFTLTIPCTYRGPAEVSYAPDVSPQLDPCRSPVLVVEDNRETLFIYEKYLKGTGFQVIPARTARMARRALKEVRPVAVVLDVLLEGESSWDLITELKSSPETRDLPVWVVTVVDNREKALGLGADDFCAKPVDRAWLLSRLVALVRPEDQEKVLLIDDDEVSRYLLKGLLADTRFSVCEPSGGAEGLRLVQVERPQVVVLDIEMSDLSGFEVLEALRADPATRRLPVIIHTSCVLTEAQREALARETVAILPKDSPNREVAQARLREPWPGLDLELNREARMPEPSPAILLVDDREANRYAVSRILQKAGFAVREAGTGAEALRLVAEQPDLVILDINLPDLSGYEVCQRIKANPVSAVIPVLHLSASLVESENRSLGLEGGADGYLVYPLEPRELVAQVRALLRIRRAEQTVRAQGDLLRVTLSSIGDGVVATDPAGLITFINPVAQNLTGWPEAEALDKPLNDVFRILNEETGAPMENPAEKVIRSGQRAGLGHHTLLVARDGTRRPIDDTASPILNDEGRFVGVVLVFRDITERRRLEDELRQRSEDLAERDQRKDEFLAMLAHELRNPLAPIRNTVQVLRRKLAGDAEVERAGGMLERQVDHLVRLVDDLMDVSRIVRGKFELRKERLDLAAVMARAVEGVRSLYEQNGHHLQIEPPAETVSLLADPARLEQVLSNLLTNAGKYTPAGGQIELKAAREGGEAVVRIRDNGIGIRPDVLPRLFDMFQQADRLPGRISEGLGLGLSLVRSLVEMHGGRVSAASAGPGSGSEFVVRLPALAPSGKAPGPEPARAPSTAPGRPLRILITDDNADAAESLAMLLRLSGHDVRTAADGQTSLRLAASFQPEAIFLDIGLPRGMNGYEVARRLRAEPKLERVLLVAMTGFGQPGDVERAHGAGFDHHLIKPADYLAIQRLLASRQQPAGS